MKQVLAKDGKVTVADVPAPFAGPRSILVRVARSCVSTGTETSGVRLSGLPLYRRALKQPEHVKKAIELMRDQGIKRTWDRIVGKLAAGTSLGYSAAGSVVAVGREVEGFREGDVVACAGAGIANHAELIDVPVNLAVHVPNGLDLDKACTVTLGAIALQGVRRAQPTLGEAFVVVGLGALGQITVQLLKSAGCRVFAVDVDPDRVAASRLSGADWAVDSSRDNYVRQIMNATDGHGADGVIITAASSESRIVSDAFHACRKKARVVLVGDVGLELKRADMYAKELDFLISTSYGPGRYDPAYEAEGVDYPIAYVRWTENRNMKAYLDLLAAGSVRFDHLATERYDIADAETAYAALQRTESKPLFVLLRYSEISESALQRKIELRAPGSDAGRIRAAVVGAGSFAQGMHLPNLVKLRDHYEVHCVMSRTGATARAAALQWRAAYATTDLDEVLSDQQVELVLICTRHDLHADIAHRALRAGKHVLVEKPLALDEEQLRPIESFYRDAGSHLPVLMTGFNRRFAPTVRRAKELVSRRTAPMIINYRMNAGFVPHDHWVHGPEGGGRNIGEACHIYDLFRYLTDAQPQQVSATPISSHGVQWRRNDNFVATISFSDGSVCSLTYTSLGDRSFPKERMEIFCEGMVISLDEYKVLEVFGARGGGLRSLTQEKGQLEELQALAACLRGKAPWPISVEEQLEATRISFDVERRLREQLDGESTLNVTSS